MRRTPQWELWLGLLGSLVWGCSILNAPDERLLPPLQEICDNGGDDDSDGRVDCEDPDCLSSFACFHRIPLQRDPPCAPLRSGEEFSFDFEGSAPYTVENLSGVGSAQIVSDGQTKRMRLNSARMTMTSSVVIGARVPFSFTAQGGVFNAMTNPNGCTIGMSLVEATPAGERTEELFVVSAQYKPLEGTLSYRCAYRETPLQAQPGEDPAQIRYEAGAPIDLKLALSAEGELVAEAGGVAVCKTTLNEIEPAVRLSFSSINTAVGECGLFLQGVQGTIAPEEPPPECDGLRRPVLPDGQCRPQPPNFEFRVDSSTGRVAGYESRPDQTDFFMLALGGTGNQLGLSLVALNRQRRWTPQNTESFQLEGRGEAFALSALMYNEQLEQMQAWVVIDDLAQLFKAPPQAPTGPWLEGELLSIQQASDYPFETFRPEAVAIHPEGYIGFAALPLPGERPPGPDDPYRSRAIFAATSRDGVRWTPKGSPVLERGEPRDWDGKGVLDPAVHWNGRFYVMAYTADPFGASASPRVGLATSRDGMVWRKHAQNPIVIGEDEGFDERGVRARSIHFEDGVIRLWYEATTDRPSPCNAPVRRQLRQLGLTRITALDP